MSEPRFFSVGDRVRFKIEHAGLYADSHWGQKLALPRLGTVVKVPEFASRTGEGTLLVQWVPLGAGLDDPKHWQKWVHSSLIDRAKE